MSEYKRFISYVYEYQDNTKGNNRGFLKVECRNGVCQISITLKGISGDNDGSCRIYGFRRTDDLLEGSFLGSAPVHKGMLHMDFRFPDGELGDRKYHIDSVAGILMLDDDDTFYATQWDDGSLNLHNFSAEGHTSQPPTIETATSPIEESLHATSADPAPDTSSWFRDGFITNCVKIMPRDIQRLHHSDWHLGNNRFVYYGFQIFGHLLLGQLGDTGETVLCVPGSYHQQECLMANMFGFKNFKQCPDHNDSLKCFGYWYRSIHPTDLCSGDRPS